MNESERQDQIESRISALEADMRRLRNVVVMLSGGRTPTSGAGVSVTGEPPAAETIAPEKRTGPARGPRDLEAWLGENGLLVVGILALVSAIGFTLKYAFDQGWISPAVRVLAGLALGLGVAAYGGRLRRRGLARYGAAAVGAGAAIAYLALWAAAGPYEFVSAGVGVAAIALLSALVLSNAWRCGQPWLAAMAALGAYGAPPLLGDVTGFPNLWLAYVAAVSVTAGTVATARSWRLTFSIVMAGTFLLGPLGVAPMNPANTGSGGAHPVWFALYVSVAGMAVLLLARARGWREHEIGAWLASWWLLGVLGLNGAQGRHAWAFLVTPGLLVAPGWLETLRGSTGAHGRKRREGSHDREPPNAPRRSPVRRLRFGASAAMWAGIAAAALSPAAAVGPLGVACLISLVYLLPGLRAQVPDLLAAGLGILALGVATQWHGTSVVLGWSALLVLGARTSGRSPLTGARWLVVTLGALAAYQLVGLELGRRAAMDPAFTGHWPVAAAVLLAAFVLLAGPLWGEGGEEEFARSADRPASFLPSRPIDLRAASWILAGAVLFAAGTSEIARAFSQHYGPSGNLAAALAVSVFWLLYAGALLATGFRRDLRAVRVGGLLVAGLAVLKVILYDLSTLDALYRVGSFALLALIALAGAYAYHQRARESRV